ncbi:efflux RND transporter permease subunit [Nannocystis sp. ILAH1]|uniref:efflux RND transporter permease subunit n=1 Tax=Nannocystis sp. ILAH1 TaxID=2996789 RepID=UPI002270F528|nr:efflux RND transporter permease subunit [Nannocystis sp. ILAH1]MCY0986813.1 efflux RND transporter permease subunit [Nannocystis sp. ILAH1]
MARRPCRFGPVLSVILALAACTAPPPPPQAEPAPPAPPVQVRVEVAVPGLAAGELEAHVAAPLEDALARLPAVRRLHARSLDGHVDVVATLTDAGAIAAVRDALGGVVANLPTDAEPPLLHRLDGVVPALAIATLPESADAVRSALERTVGVGRVEVCGVGERRLAVLLDRSRLAGVPIDALVDAVTTTLADPDSAPLFERLVTRPITANLQLRDVAVLQDGPRPSPCRAYAARGPVSLVTAFTQSGADPSDVAARARPHAVDLVSPTVDFFADLVPADGELAVLGAALPPRDDLGSSVAACLAAVPDLPAWALTVTAPGPGQSLARVRLLAGLATTFPIEHVRITMSKCTDGAQVAVFAPRAHADHVVSLAVQGPDPDLRAGLARRLGERLAGLPGVTGLRVLAPGPGAQAVQLRREALAAHGVPLAAAVTAVRLAAGPLTVRGPLPALGLRPWPELAADIDMLDRTGPLDQQVRDLHVASPSGPIPLSDLVELQASSSGGPLDRIDRVPTAAVEVRLRRAADGDAVRREINQLELPPGFVVAEGGELPDKGP